MSNIRVPVVDPEKKSLMPTTCSRARRWMEQGKAIPKWSDLGVFYVQLVKPPSSHETQPINIGIDPGKRYSGVAVQSKKHTLLMLHLVLMGFIPKQGTAMAGVNSKMDYRKLLRRGRRGRRINRKVSFKFRNHRQKRFDNRRKSKLAPSIRSNRQLELRVVAELCKVFPISTIVYERVRADVDLTSGRKGAKSGKGFSAVMVGQSWMLEQLQQFAPTITKEGWQQDGNGTSQIRQYLKLVKDKKNKEAQLPQTHAVDAIALASTTFVQYKPFHTANSHGHLWYGEVSITNAIFKVISRPRITRRRLHDAVPAKGGVRERYGGSTTPFGIRKGDLVAYGQQLGYCSGYTNNKLSISDANWKRLGQRAISKCRLVARSKGLVVSGTSSPTHPPLHNLPAL
ncbi:RRXRR domain-containing protein [Scytonema sp. NUACC26]|uniref:RRXRR domain-containing protein n=1 Tax=Scytonema sp. NUACC26 TaxID=3140176 RepID=UPI0034DC324A